MPTSEAASVNVSTDGAAGDQSSDALRVAFAQPLSRPAGFLGCPAQLLQPVVQEDLGLQQVFCQTWRKTQEQHDSLGEFLIRATA